MFEQLVSMGLSFFLIWLGRDKVWTPTFEGTQQQRFLSAMRHYQVKMRLEDTLYFDLEAKRAEGQDDWCASVELMPARVGMDPAFLDPVLFPEQVAVRWYGSNKRCSYQEPEYWALHEACHLRMQHHRNRAPNDRRHDEVKRCMIEYSKPERR